MYIHCTPLIKPVCIKVLSLLQRLYRTKYVDKQHEKRTFVDIVQNIGEQKNFKSLSKMGEPEISLGDFDALNPKTENPKLVHPNKGRPRPARHGSSRRKGGTDDSEGTSTRPEDDRTQVKEEMADDSGTKRLKPPAGGILLGGASLMKEMMNKRKSKEVKGNIEGKTEREPEKEKKQTRVRTARKSSTKEATTDRKPLDPLPTEKASTIESRDKKDTTTRPESPESIYMSIDYDLDRKSSDKTETTKSDRGKGDAPSAIIQGAALYGHQPEIVSIQKAKVTYGCRASLPFDEAKHDESRKIISKRDGQARCKGAFREFVKAGEDLKNPEERTLIVHPKSKTEKSTSVAILKSEKNTVLYSDEEGVTELGKIRVRATDGYLGENIQVKIYFGHTELLVEATDLSKESGSTEKAYLSFT